MDDIDHLSHVLSPDDRINQRHRTGGALPGYTSYAIASIVQILGQWERFILDDQADDLGSDGKLVFNIHADVIPSSKTCGISQVGNNVMGMADDLRNDRYPDEYFNKTEDRRQVPFTPGDEDDAQCAQADICNPGKENQ